MDNNSQIRGHGFGEVFLPFLLTFLVLLLSCGFGFPDEIAQPTTETNSPQLPSENKITYHTTGENFPQLPYDEKITHPTTEKYFPQLPSEDKITHQTTGKDFPELPSEDKITHQTTGKYFPQLPSEDEITHQTTGKAFPQLPSEDNTTHQTTGKDFPQLPSEEEITHQTTGKDFPLLPSEDEISHQTTGKDFPQLASEDKITHPTTGKDFPQLPSEDKITHQTTGKDFPQLLSKDKTTHQTTGKDFPQLPSEEEITHQTTGKDFPQLLSEDEITHQTTGKDFPQLPSEDEISQQTTGKDFPQLPSEDEISHQTTGKDLPQLPSEDEISHQTTGTEFPQLPSEDEITHQTTGNDFPRFPSENELTRQTIEKDWCTTSDQGTADPTVAYCQAQPLTDRGGYSPYTTFNVSDFIASPSYRPSVYPALAGLIVIRSMDEATKQLLLNGTDTTSGLLRVVLEAPAAMVFKFRISGNVFEHILKFWDAGWADTVTEQLYGYEPTFYSVSNFVFVEVETWQLGSMDAVVQFDVVSACEVQLDVFCSSNNLGYIQTPGWDSKKTYPANMRSCTTLEVPDDHTVMVSVVRMQLETAEDCLYDNLFVFTDTTDCHGSYEKICEIEDAETQVYNVRTISFRFTADNSKSYRGFRIIYSFHPSDRQPEKFLDSGLWDCAVPFYADFEPHLMCTLSTLCSADSRVTQFRCGLGKLCDTDTDWYEVNGGCYRRHFDLRLSWDKAADVCGSYGAHLMDVNSVEERAFLYRVMQIQHAETWYLGIRLTSSTSLDMYQLTWMYSDETLVLDFDLEFPFGSVEPCVAMFDAEGHVRLLRTVSCGKDRDAAAFFCEFARTGGESEENNNRTTAIQLPTATTESPWPGPGMTVCDYDQHVAHDFLACDARSQCFLPSEASLCYGQFSPVVPYFTCRSTTQRIPYTLVCDHRPDCCDTSDEDFCQYPVCVSRTSFLCEDKKQCIPRAQECDRVSQCVDGSDELRCLQNIQVVDVTNNHVKPPAVVTFTGKGGFVVTPLNSSAGCPLTHFRCPGPGDSYCLPVYVRCNNVNDCPGKEDEEGCEAYRCPGLYRCRQSRVCLHRQHLCDGVFQCPLHDDELTCDTVCPAHCTCYGHAFICTRSFSPDRYPELRFLEARGSGVTLSDVSSNKLLVHLGLRGCGVSSVGRLDLPNLQVLDLSHNRLVSVSSADLSQFTNLMSVDLAFNPFVSVSLLFDTQHSFVKIHSMNLAGLNLPELRENLSTAFPHVQNLNMSFIGLERVPESGFRPFKRLSNLDLRGCSVRTFYPGVFEGLRGLRTLHADNYKLCCPSVLPETMPEEGCQAPSDELSSCDALLRSDAFRVFLSLYATMALVGNFGGFLYRCLTDRASAQNGYNTFVTHLCVADFMMGVYLAIIGVADSVYYGNYLWVDLEWKNSVACKVAGFLSMLSSEVSAFLICIITVERFLVLRFPLRNLRFSRRSAGAACLALWGVGVLLAAVPLLPHTRHWEFYSQSGICIPLPITRKRFPGSEYAFAVMIVLNFALFTFIAVGQALIYWSVQANRMAAAAGNVSGKKSQDMVIARRLLAVVMTDFLCWFPIGLLGVLARAGVPISGDVSVVMAIFVLPLNSALNPFLYTFNMVMEKRRVLSASSTSGR